MLFPLVFFFYIKHSRNLFLLVFSFGLEWIVMKKANKNLKKILMKKKDLTVTTKLNNELYITINKIRMNNSGYLPCFQFVFCPFI